MNKVFVNDIRDKSRVESAFLVKEKIESLARNGKPYLTLYMMDKSGEIEGRVWENVETIGARFEKNDFIFITAKATVYLGKMQLIIAELSRIPDDKVNLPDFLPAGERNSDEMLDELASVVESCRDADLRRLLEAFFTDADFLDLYSTAPAAKGMHHVYLGGLLEHSLAVARLVDLITPVYPGLNRDLLVAGALLHDVGKVREMTYLRSFDYTDEGKLLGHISIGVEMVHEKISRIRDFPEELSMLLKHMILAHHGQYEYGSPKRPKTIEATVLNYLDDLDSKINGIRTHMRKETASQARWTAYHRLYDRYFYKDNRCEDPLPAPGERARGDLPVADPSDTGPECGKKEFRNSPFESLQGKGLDLS
ncbi:MAG: HD domain-containing protein [Geobacteraceae bacterium]|nr:HD domain-containing protein [Geobacteraceae bacterium]